MCDRLQMGSARTSDARETDRFKKMVTYGFIPKNGKKARSVGFEKEIHPAIGTAIIAPSSPNIYIPITIATSIATAGKLRALP